MTHSLYAKSNLTPLWQKPPSMEAISQIIKSVGLFVPSSPDFYISSKMVTISTISENQLFLISPKSNRNGFWQSSPSTEDISQIIKSVGLFVPNSPLGDHVYQKSAILISPQKWLDEVRDFVFSTKLLGDVWDVVYDSVMKHNSLSLSTIFIHLYFWKLPYFSIAHARNFGQVTSLIVHDPMLVCKIKPQTLLTKTSRYGGHISNNKVCRFICSK